MKKILLFIFSILYLSIYSQTAQLTFQKRYGGADFDFGACVQVTNDGGFIITGNSYSFGTGNSNVYLLKTNLNGSLQWAKTYDYNEYFQAGYSVLQTKDGGFIVSGFKYNMVNPNDNGTFLLKTFSDGTVQWTKSFSGGDYVSSIQQTKDGGFVIAGSTNKNGAGNYDYNLIKTDSVGNLQWIKTYGGTANEKAYSVKQTSDEGFIISGYTLSFSGNYDTYLVKTSSNGTLQWSKTYSQTYGLGNYVLQTIDGGYVIVSEGLKIIKTDSIGGLKWTKAYVGASAYSIEQTRDNGLIISGSYQGRAYLLKADSNGIAQFEKTFGDTATAMFVHQTKDTGYIVVGYTYGLGAEKGDIYLVKVDNNGNAGCYDYLLNTTFTSPIVIVTDPPTQVFSAYDETIPVVITQSGGSEITLCSIVGIKEISEENTVNIYPNPSSGIINVTLGTIVETKVCVYDLLGNCVFEKVPMKNKQEIDLASQPKGIYLMEIMSEGQRVIRKIILQ